MGMKGHLLFHSESGTEGGWYAWQDDDHVHGGNKGDQCPWKKRGRQIDCPVERGVWHQHARYEGLNLLKNGDHLRIFHSHAPTVLWEGVVNFTLRDDVYKNPEATIHGLWVNQEPVGVDRTMWADWFFEELPCELLSIFPSRGGSEA